MRISDWSSDVCSSDLPELRIIPQELWDAVKVRQATLDAKVDAQQRESGGSNRRAGIGAARRSLTALAGRLFCGNCGGKMTASGGHYVQCSTAVRTGGSICANKKNHRRSEERRVGKECVGTCRSRCSQDL